MRKDNESNQDVKGGEGKSIAAPAAAPAASIAVPGVWGAPFGLLQDFDRHFEEMARLVRSDLFPSAAMWGKLPTVTRALPAFEPARADLVDEGKQYVLTADLPGFQKDQ